MRDLFTGLARDAGAADADHLASQLVLLYDGASVSGQMEAGQRGGRGARNGGAAAGCGDGEDVPARTRPREGRA